MSVFRYRMQNILNLKLKLEDNSRMKYALQRRVLALEEEKLEGLKKRLGELKEESRALRLKKLNFRDIKENKSSIDYMNTCIAAQLEVIARESAVLEERRQELETVMKERKAQEKLREKAFEEFMKEENAAESKAIDELTSYRYGAGAV